MNTQTTFQTRAQNHENQVGSSNLPNAAPKQFVFVVDAHGKPLGIAPFKHGQHSSSGKQVRFSDARVKFLEAK